jgi:hypothetical protein
LIKILFDPKHFLVYHRTVDGSHPKMCKIASHARVAAFLIVVPTHFIIPSGVVAVENAPTMRKT